MKNIEPWMQDTSDDQYEEEWEVRLSGGGRYTLSKNQARVLMQEMATGNRGVIPFQTFVISIPYVVEFYRVRRYLKNAKKLPDRATEKPYKPMSKKEWEEWKRKAYAAIGRPMKK